MVVGQVGLRDGTDRWLNGKTGMLGQIIPLKTVGLDALLRLHKETCGISGLLFQRSPGWPKVTLLPKPPIIQPRCLTGNPNRKRRTSAVRIFKMGMAKAGCTNLLRRVRWQRRGRLTGLLPITLCSRGT